jgi:hypothetical protein
MHDLGIANLSDELRFEPGNSSFGVFRKSQLRVWVHYGRVGTVPRQPGAVDGRRLTKVFETWSASSAIPASARAAASVSPWGFASPSRHQLTSLLNFAAGTCWQSDAASFVSGILGEARGAIQR